MDKKIDSTTSKDPEVASALLMSRAGGAALLIGVLVGTASFVLLMRVLRGPDQDFLGMALLAFVGLVVGLVGGLITYWLGDSLGLVAAVPVRVNGVVKAKYFTPSRTSTGTGVGVSPSGGTSVVATTSNSPEDFTVELLLDGSDRKVRISVEERSFDATEIGDRVVASYRVSRFSGQTHWHQTVVPLTA